MISKHIKKEQRTGRWPIGRSPRWRNPRCAPPCPNRNNWYYSWDNAYGRTTFARYPSEWSLGWKLWNELWSRRATAFARTWSSLPSWWLEARSTIPCPWWTGTKHCRLEEKTINGTNLRKKERKKPSEEERSIPFDRFTCTLCEQLLRAVRPWRIKGSGCSFRFWEQERAR